MLLLFADDRIIITQDIIDASYVMRKLVEDNKTWELNINDKEIE